MTENMQNVVGYHIMSHQMPCFLLLGKPNQSHLDHPCTSYLASKPIDTNSRPKVGKLTMGEKWLYNTCTTIIDISPRIFRLIYCCCVSIIIVICICPPGALIWLINLFLFLFHTKYLPQLHVSTEDGGQGGSMSQVIQYRKGHNRDQSP